MGSVGLGKLVILQLNELLVLDPSNGQELSKLRVPDGVRRGPGPNCDINISSDSVYFTGYNLQKELVTVVYDVSTGDVRYSVVSGPVYKFHERYILFTNEGIFNLVETKTGNRVSSFKYH